jgi:hypothetical protein
LLNWPGSIATYSSAARSWERDIAEQTQKLKTSALTWRKPKLFAVSQAKLEPYAMLSPTGPLRRTRHGRLIAYRALSQPNAETPGFQREARLFGSYAARRVVSQPRYTASRRID